MRFSKAKDDLTPDYKEILNIIYHQYGYDFSNYSPGHVQRRIRSCMSKNRISDPGKLIDSIRKDEQTGLSLVREFSISVTEMFRNPAFYISMRKHVIPVLKTYPQIRIWHAGCSTGEEVYSMAILLAEEGIYRRCRIYGTDFNMESLRTAKKGIYPVERIRRYTGNYQMAEGSECFSKYYFARYGAAIMNGKLKKNLVWSDHNLVTDRVFNEVHLIICKNVLIYFNKKLQEKVVSLFDESLIRGGFLCLGDKETLRFSSLMNKYETLDKKTKIYQKDQSEYAAI